MDFNKNQDADATVGDQTATSGKEVRQLRAGELRTENKGGSAAAGASGYDWTGLGWVILSRDAVRWADPLLGPEEVQLARSEVEIAAALNVEERRTMMK
nr:unnamed protein product [Callosobruchus chinensis]